MADDIVSQVKIEGATQAAAELNKVGDAGVAMGDKIAKGANTASQSIKTVDSASRSFGSAIRGAGAGLATFGSNVTRVVGTLARYSTFATAAIVAARKLSGASDQSAEDSKVAQKALEVESQALEQRAIQTLQNEKAFRDLSRQLAAGEINVTEYGKAFNKLRIEQQEEQDIARQSELIRSAEQQQRVRRMEQLKKEAAEQQAFNSSVKAFGADTAGALSQFGRAFDNFMTRFNEGPSVVAGIIRSIASLLQSNGQEIIDTLNSIGREFAAVFTGDNAKGAKDLGETLLDIFRQVTGFIKDTVIPAFRTVIGVLDTVAKGINSVFGTNFTGGGLAIVLVVTQLLGGFKLLLAILPVITTAFTVLTTAMAAAGFTPLGIAIRLVIAAIVLLVTTLATLNWARFRDAAMAAVNAVIGFFSSLPDTILGFFTSIWESIVSGFNTAWQAVRDGWAAVMTFISDTWNSIKQGAADAWNFLKSSASSAFDAVLSFIQPVIDKVKQLWDLIKSAASALLGLSGASAEAGGGGGGGFARGGIIRGPGTGTSDSILARVSRGEGILTAEAVRHYGAGLVHMINSLRLPGFAEGGVISGVHFPQMAFAGGGIVGNAGKTRPIVLQFPDGQEFNMAASEDTAQNLGRYSAKRRLASSGRKPTYYGGGR